MWVRHTLEAQIRLREEVMRTEEVPYWRIASPFSMSCMYSLMFIEMNCRYEKCI